MPVGDPKRHFFHCCSAQAELPDLLDPEQQWSEPWGAPEHGPCDKCEGSGVADYECRSCIEAGAVADCPACRGRVRFRDTCPACMGSGEIRHTKRRGIAVLPTREGLYRYLAEKDANLEGRLVVALEGTLAVERDLDADAGVLLLHPTRIVEARPLDTDLVESIRVRG